MSIPPPPDGYDPTQPTWSAAPPPRRPKWPWAVAGAALVAIVAAVAALVVVLTRSSDTDRNDTVAASPSVSTVTVTAAPTPEPESTQAPAPARETKPAAPAPGLPTHGILKVGVDIAPGEYAVRPIDPLGGYWERLACLTGDYTCLTANDYVQGNSYVAVLPGDVALRIEDLELTPTGGSVPVPQPSRTAPSFGSTDGQGFVGVPDARCNHTNPAVAVGQTTESLVVVCRTGVGRYYYKGVRLSDGAAIEIDDPVETVDGFVATNNGVKYRISPISLTITEGSTLLAEEPMLQYWLP